MEGHLVGGHRGGADPGRHRGADQERPSQRQVPDHQIGADQREAT